MSKKEVVSTSLPMWKKVAYGSGNAGGGFIWGTVTTFLLMYCTNVIGISAAVVGSLLMVAKVFDGVTDIFMGRIIDLTKIKMGKTRFWYLLSCIPLGVCMFLLFNVPGWMDNGIKSAYIFIFYLLISAVFYTMNQVAYNMMLARVTRDQHDQVTMSGSAMLFGMIGSLVVASVTSGLVESFGGGQTGWTIVAAIYAVVGVVISLIPFFALRELPEAVFEDPAEDVEKGGKISFIQTIKELLSNKYFILMLVLYFFGYANSGIMQSSMVYFSTYILNNPALMGVLGLCSTIPLLVGLPFMPKLIDKTGMRKGCVWGSIVSIAGCVISILGQLFVGFPVMLVGLLIKGFGSLPGSATYTPFLVKADEYHYQKKGHRVTGSLFSCATVGTKIGQGLGTAMCGWILAFSGFDGLAAIQSSSTNNAIIFMYLGLPLIFTVLLAIIYNMMKVEDDVMQK